MANAEIFLYYRMDIFECLITLQWLLLAHHQCNFPSWHTPPNACVTHILMIVWDLYWYLSSPSKQLESILSYANNSSRAKNRFIRSQLSKYLGKKKQGFIWIWGKQLQFHCFHMTKLLFHADFYSSQIRCYIKS